MLCTGRKTAVGARLTSLHVSNNIFGYRIQWQKALREFSWIPSIAKVLKRVDITIDNLPSFITSHSVFVAFLEIESPRARIKAESKNVRQDCSIHMSWHVSAICSPHAEAAYAWLTVSWLKGQPNGATPLFRRVLPPGRVAHRVCKDLPCFT